MRCTSPVPCTGMQDERMIVGNHIHSVLFDMDNTLFDFIHAQQSACRAVLSHVGHDADPDDLFSYFRRPIHGFEHHDNIRDYLFDHDLFSDRVFAECCGIYETVKVASVEPYPGVPRILGFLCDNGLPLGIITDAETPQAEKRLDKAGLSRYFTTVVSPDRSGARKPDPASFQLALDELQVKPEEAVLAGDSLRRDIAPAQKIGMVTVYARYGDWYRTPDQEYCTPDFVAGSVTEMERVLSSLIKS